LAEGLLEEVKTDRGDPGGFLPITAPCTEQAKVNGALLCAELGIQMLKETLPPFMPSQAAAAPRRSLNGSAGMEATRPMVAAAGNEAEPIDVPTNASIGVGDLP